MNAKRMKRNLLTAAMAIGVTGILSGCGAPGSSSNAGTFADAFQPAVSAATPMPSVVVTAAPTAAPSAVSSTASSASDSPAATATPQSAVTGAKETGSAQKAESTPQTAATPKMTAAPGTASSKTASPAVSGTPAISWSGFFEDDKQNRPSERFWDLSEKRSTVEIKGYMGEVLSFDKRWFLLIPQPGAECPFDNGDETYWNKIMIVFVPESTQLRFTSGPLKVTGRLDVGIKIDESGYKTMFRLYDAKFEKIKE